MATRGSSTSSSRGVGRGRNYKTGDPRNTGGGVGRGRGRSAPRSTEEGTRQSHFEGAERRAVGRRQGESLGPTLTMPGTCHFIVLLHACTAIGSSEY